MGIPAMKLNFTLRNMLCLIAFLCIAIWFLKFMSDDSYIAKFTIDESSSVLITKASSWEILRPYYVLLVVDHTIVCKRMLVCLRPDDDINIENIKVYYSKHNNIVSIVHERNMDAYDVNINLTTLNEEPSDAMIRRANDGSYVPICRSQ